jgi:hypothetical protein
MSAVPPRLAVPDGDEYIGAFEHSPTGGQIGVDPRGLRPDLLDLGGGVEQAGELVLRLGRDEVGGVVVGREGQDDGELPPRATQGSPGHEAVGALGHARHERAGVADVVEHGVDGGAQLGVAVRRQRSMTADAHPDHGAAQ